MPPTPSRPTRRHALPGPPRPAAPHDPEAPSDSYSTALTWTPSFPTDEVSGKPGVVHHAVFDEVAAGAFDDAGGDGPAFLESFGVVEVAVFVGEIGGAFVGAGAFVAAQPGPGRGAADGRCCVACFAVEDVVGVAADPGFGCGIAFGVQGPGRFPHVFQNMDEVDQDRDGHAPVGCFVFDLLDLVVVAVDQGDPGALAGGVAAVGFVEDLGDDARGVLDDAGGEPFAGGDRPGY